MRVSLLFNVFLDTQISVPVRQHPRTVVNRNYTLVFFSVSIALVIINLFARISIVTGLNFLISMLLLICSWWSVPFADAHANRIDIWLHSLIAWNFLTALVHDHVQEGARVSRAMWWTELALALAGLVLLYLLRKHRWYRKYKRSATEDGTGSSLLAKEDSAAQASNNKEDDDDEGDDSFIVGPTSVMRKMISKRFSSRPKDLKEEESKQGSEGKADK